jgi:WD40 repeat protein
VWNEEQLVVSDYPTLNTNHRWRNESVSKQSGRGTLAPLLATKDWVIAGTTFGEVFVFDAKTGNLLNSAVPLENRVGGMCQIAAQPLIAVGSSDGEILVLELPSLKESQVMSVNQRSIDALCFDETRQWLFAGSEDGTISVFRLAQDRFEPYFTINLKIGRIQKLIYLRDSDSLAMLVKNETAVRLIRPQRIHDTLKKIGLL